MIVLSKHAVELVPDRIAIVKNALENDAADRYLPLVVEETKRHWVGQMAFSRGKKYFDKGHTMCRFGDAGVTYEYKGKPKPMHPWTSTLAVLRDILHAMMNWRANCCVVNTYMPTSHLYPHRDGNYIPQLGANPVIVGLSFGATRTFQLKPWNFDANKKDASRPTLNIALEHGDLLIMHGDCDTTYKHGIPEEPEADGQRISLTFRKHMV